MYKNCFDCKNAIPVSLFEPYCLCKAQNKELVRAATYTEEPEGFIGCELWEEVDE